MDTGLLTENRIRIGAAYASKVEAIRDCGRLLLEAGCVEPGYIDAMVERDALSTVYVGNGVAVPHGTKAGIAFVKKTGLAVVQVPGGVDFGRGDVAYLLVAIAALGNGHIDLLTEIAGICADDDRLAALLAAKTPREVLDLIGGAEA